MYESIKIIVDVNIPFSNRLSIAPVPSGTKRKVTSIPCFSNIPLSKHILKERKKERKRGKKRERKMEKKEEKL